MPHPTVQFTARVETPEGPLAGQVSIYTGPTRLAELVPAVSALTGGLVGLTINRERREGREVSCRPGCAACCRLMVSLSIPEAFFLQDLVASIRPERHQVLIERFGSGVNRMEAEGLYARLQKPGITDEDNLQIAKEYFKLNLACPFLENEGCTIYPVRPLACQEYHVTTPPEWCADPFTNQIRNLKPAVPVPVVLAHLAAKMLDQPARMIPLTLALRWAAENAELNQRTWPGKELFEQFLAQFNSWGKKDSTAENSNATP